MSDTLILVLLIVATIVLTIYVLMLRHQVSRLCSELSTQEANSVRIIHLFTNALGGRVIEDGTSLRVVGLHPPPSD